MEHRIFCIDGTRINLPKELLRNGYPLPSPKAFYPQAKLSCLFELKSKIPYDGGRLSEGRSAARGQQEQRLEAVLAHAESKVAEYTAPIHQKMEAEKQKLPELKAISNRNRDSIERVKPSTSNNSSDAAAQRILERRAHRDSGGSRQETTFQVGSDGNMVMTVLCFPGETPISVKVGKEYASKPISSIKIGDSVVSCNLTTYATCELAQVQNVMQRQADHLIKFTFDGKTLRTTDEHPFYVVEKNDWIPAQHISVGEHFRSITGETVELEDKQYEDGDFTVYNLDVKGNHNYYACDVLVHNCTAAERMPALFAPVIAPFAIPLQPLQGVRSDIRRFQELADRSRHTGNTETREHRQENTSTHTPERREGNLGSQTEVRDHLGNTSTTTPIQLQHASDTVVERIPRIDGIWSGTPGDSNWISTNPDVIRVTHGAPVPFRDQYPDFSEWAQQRYDFPNLNGSHQHDFALGDRRLVQEHGRELGLRNQADAARYRQTNDLTWHHHQDGRTLELVPRPLNNEIPHDGGSSILRNRQQSTQ